jgi:hypothetical protein
VAQLSTLGSITRMNKYDIILIALGIFSWLWLWFMIARPKQWSSFVDKENDFWLKRGIVSASFSERSRRFEKGLGQKILVGSTAILSTVGLLVIHFLIWKHTHR